MNRQSRLICTMLAAGASLSASALAQTSDKAPASLPVPAEMNSNNIQHRATVAAPGRVDAKALLAGAPMGGLRGVPGCPDPMFDLANCHVFEPDVLPTPTSNGRAGDFRTMDNFRPSTANPTRICWVGRYQNRTGPFVANESFQINIYADNAGFPDLASGPLFTREFNQQGSAGVDLLQMDCLENAGPCPGTTTEPANGGWYTYSAEVAAGFPLAAQTCYWMEIVCTGSATAMPPVDTDRLWRWGASRGGPDLSSLQAVDGNYTLFTRVENDRAFCVSGGLNTNPGSCGLAPLPPVCNNPDTNGIPYDGAFGYIVRSSSPGSNGGSVWTPTQFAENFTFTSPTAVTNICFWGFWVGTNDTGGLVATGMPANESYQITYYSNAGALGVPGPAVPMATFNTGDPGVSLQSNMTPLDLQASITHPPVNFTANECHWVSVSSLNTQQAAGQPPVPQFWWQLTTGPSVPAADLRIGNRTAGAVPGAWGAATYTIEGSTAGSNLAFLLDGGPVIAQNCITAAACQITLPGGLVQENEPNCGGGAGGADTVNGGCNSTPQVYGTLNCGQTLRGTVAVAGGTRDTDWYKLTVNSTQIVTVTANAEFVGFAAFISDATGLPVPGTFDCAAAFLNPTVDTGMCQAGTMTATLEPGTYTIVLVPDFAVPIACGQNVGSEYTIGVSCTTPPPPPANDFCANAVTLDTPCTGTDVTVNGTTVSSTTDGGVACGTSTAQSAGGVWYKVTGNGSPITVNSCSTVGGYDSQISVYTGGCGAMACVAGNDDGCGVVGGMSNITFNSTDGTDYYILVHGWQASTGNFTLVLSSAGTCEGGSCPPDWNDDGDVNSGDISSFLTAWIASVQAGNLVGDFNNDGATNSGDISAFLTAWIAAVQAGGC